LWRIGSVSGTTDEARCGNFGRCGANFGAGEIGSAVRVCGSRVERGVMGEKLFRAVALATLFGIAVGADDLEIAPVDGNGLISTRDHSMAPEDEPARPVA